MPCKASSQTSQKASCAARSYIARTRVRHRLSRPFTLLSSKVRSSVRRLRGQPMRAEVSLDIVRDGSRRRFMRRSSWRAAACASPLTFAEFSSAVWAFARKDPRKRSGEKLKINNSCLPLRMILSMVALCHFQPALPRPPRRPW